VDAALTRRDALEAGDSLLFGCRVEGDALEVGVAFVADEAARVEALAAGTQDAAGDGKGAVCAQGAGLSDRGAVVGGRFAREGGGVGVCGEWSPPWRGGGEGSLGKSGSGW
jgi:hypothetical protein